MKKDDWESLILRAPREAIAGDTASLNLLAAYLEEADKEKQRKVTIYWSKILLLFAASRYCWQQKRGKSNGKIQFINSFGYNWLGQPVYLDLVDRPERASR